MNFTAVLNMKVQNASYVYFEDVQFKQYYGENNTFLALAQESTLILNFTKILFKNCIFSNFTFFKTTTILKNLNVYINGLTFLNCTLNNFQLIQNSL